MRIRIAASLRVSLGPWPWLGRGQTLDLLPRLLDHVDPLGKLDVHSREGRLGKQELGLLNCGLVTHDGGPVKMVEVYLNTFSKERLADIAERLADISRMSVFLLF